MASAHDTIVAVDIGSTKVSIVAAQLDNDALSVTGIARRASHGLKKGVIINIETTIDSIREALEEIETMTGTSIHNAYATISGSHIECQSNLGTGPVRTTEICQTDIDWALEAAANMVIPADREVIQIITQEFIVDGRAGVQDPRGMTANQLGARACLVSADSAALQHHIRCLNRCGIKVTRFGAAAVASAEACLSADEKKLGCLLIDFGGGTTDIAIYANDALQTVGVLPIGGGHITSDIAIGLRTPLAEAEEIKCASGSADPAGIDSTRTLEISPIGTGTHRIIEHSTLNRIIHARVKETFELVGTFIDESGLRENVKMGAVITGGSAQLDGICAAAAEALGMETRIGVPAGIGGINDIHNPCYASAAGLIIAEADDRRAPRPGTRRGGIVRRTGARLWRWLADTF